MPAEAKKHILGVALLFASNGIMLAGLLPWYPSFKNQWDLSGTTFGLVVACVAAGSIASGGVPVAIIRRIGPKNAVLVGTVFMSALLLSAVFAPSPLTFAIVLGSLGFVDPIVDVAQNMVAVRVQESHRKSWMSSWHACWSLGATGSGALGTWAVGHLPIGAHLCITATASLLCAIVGCSLIGPWRAASTSEQTRAAKGNWWLVLPLVLVAVSGIMVEEVANSWAALAAREIGQMPIEQAGLAFTVMLAAQCLGRFAGDPMINRWGRVTVARLGGLSIAIGGLCVVLSQEPTALLVGLALAGFGCATIVPSAFVAAAKIPGMSEGAGITLVSWLMRIGFLGTSPFIGLISDLAGLRAGLGILLVGGVVIVALSNRLRS
ncbi:MFS transporter [Staphylococcus chromogenes]|nr:MFS transporter [Staphylococcus chromogenes]